MLYPPFYIFPREFFQNFLRKLVEIFLLQMRLFFGKMLVINIYKFLKFSLSSVAESLFFKKATRGVKIPRDFHNVLNFLVDFLFLNFFPRENLNFFSEIIFKFSWKNSPLKKWSLHSRKVTLNCV